MKAFVVFILAVLGFASVVSTSEISQDYDPFHIHDGFNTTRIEPKTYWQHVKRFLDQHLIKPLSGNFTDKHLEVISKAFAADHYRHQLEFEDEAKQHDDEIQKIKATLEEERAKRIKAEQHLSALSKQLENTNKTLHNLKHDVDLSTRSQNDLKGEKAEILAILNMERKKSQKLAMLMQSISDLAAEIQALSANKL